MHGVLVRFSSVDDDRDELCQDDLHAEDLLLDVSGRVVVVVQAIWADGSRAGNDLLADDVRAAALRVTGRLSRHAVDAD
jgi:hypothetical protein